MKRKLYDYQGMGIKQIWVIEPETGDWWKFVDGQLVTETEFRQGGINFEISAIATELED